MKKIDPKVIVALDFSQTKDALRFIESVSPELCRLKVGKELFTTAGPQLVEQLVKKEFDVFLDLKFHDIPNTVNKAISASCNMGVWMVNVHALGGREMMSAARQAVSDSDVHKPLLIAVSILTSTNQSGLNELGIDKTVKQAVIDLTQMSLDCGMDGMVCSAQEVSELRQEFSDKPIFVTPGIRPEGSAKNDQKRIMTPMQAMEAGSSYLVIGRPITQHKNPADILADINKSL